MNPIEIVVKDTGKCVGYACGGAVPVGPRAALRSSEGVSVTKPDDRLSGSHRWVANWLKRRGYKLTHATGCCEYWSLPSLHRGLLAEACALTVLVDSDRSSYTATFRPLAEPDIHVTRYLILGRKEGRDKLIEFETVAQRCRVSLSGNLRTMETT